MKLDARIKKGIWLWETSPLRGECTSLHICFRLPSQTQKTISLESKEENPERISEEETGDVDTPKQEQTQTMEQLRERRLQKRRLQV
jgi:hypothetical protein